MDNCPHLVCKLHSSGRLKKLPSIKLCLLLDFIGMLSYIIPFVGESFDLVWAPVSAVIYYFMFGSRLGLRGALVEFLEEWFPFTDIIPTFTISWFIRRAGNLGKDRDKRIN